jgi:hypothetical protein
MEYKQNTVGTEDWRRLLKKKTFYSQMMVARMLKVVGKNLSVIKIIRVMMTAHLNLKRRKNQRKH